MKKLIGTALCAAVLVLPMSPAHAAIAGAGADITGGPASGRFVVGGASYAVTPIVNTTYARVDFECHAVAGPDASQTRVSGCVLYKGSTVIARASVGALPGPAAQTSGSAVMDLSVPGPVRLCWSAGVTFVLNIRDLENEGCTSIHV